MPGYRKNIGPAGAVAVIARKKFIEGRSKALHSMLNYETHLDNGSLYNTPPAFCGLYRWQGCQVAEGAGRTGDDGAAQCG